MSSILSTNTNADTTSTTSTCDINSTEENKLENALRQRRADAKYEFELQQTDVYNSLSVSYQQMLGQIILAKWKKVYFPALVLSPYSVPPGQVRKMWMDKFEKVRLAS